MKCIATAALALFIGHMLTLSVSAEVVLSRISSENASQTIPKGKEVDAIYGDVALTNGMVTAVIAQPIATRNANMTVREVAGCLLDFTTTKHGGNDQLSAYYPGSRVYPFRKWSVRGAGVEQTDLDQGSVWKHDKSLELVVVAEGSDKRAELEVVYRLESGSPVLTVQQTFRNRTQSEVQVVLSDDIRYDSGKEIVKKSPNGSNDFYYIDDVYWRQCYAVTQGGGPITSRSDSRLSLLKYGRGSRQPDLTLKPGEQFTHTLQLHVGNSLFDLREQITRVDQQCSCPTTVLVMESQNGPIPGARAEVTQQGEYIGTAWSDGSGRVEFPLTAGDYEVTADYLGNEIVSKKPVTVPQTLGEIRFQAGFGTATVKLNFKDEAGHPIPCKVELIPKTPGIQAIDFGPETAIRRVRNLLYLADGQDEALVPAGEYELIVSRGPEYDALFLDVAFKADQKTEVSGTLVRSVDSTGWVSTEYHSHSSPSGDNTSHQMGRVYNLACEHLEFAPCTEHNRIDTYSTHLEKLGLTDLVATCSGMELTGSPLPLNHQNVFPLIYRPGMQDGGGPITDISPETQIQRIALWDNRSEKLVQQNHPDIGWLFYDKNGDQVIDEGYRESFPFIDAMEIHPITAVLNIEKELRESNRVRKNRIFNWLQLLNQGFRITGVVNTDSHYNYHGSGGLRNWVQSSTDDPAEIKTDEMVKATERGNSVMSNGPFLLVEAKGGSGDQAKTVGPGSDLVSTEVDLSISVQCANWFDVDRVFVLANGHFVPELNFTRKENPNLFGPTTQAVRFKHAVKHRISSDTHLVVVAAGENSKLGPVAGPSWGAQQPVAIANPIFVDYDGKGFQPSKDTIDDGLPVKGE